jgi:hypothetical protein
MTGTCTGSATDISSVSHNCSVITATDWPRNPSPSIDAFTLGQFVLTGGTPSSYSQQQNFSQSAWFFEGTQGIAVAGQGPGPFSFLGNYLEGTGLMVHLDDTSIVDPQSVWFRQNTFFWDQKHKMGSATSDGYEYANRNGPECKHCRMVKFDGNIVTGMWNSVSLTGPAILFHTASNQGTAGTAGGVGQPGYTVQDIDVTNNTFWNVSAGIEVGGGVMDMTPQPAAARIRIKNNIFNTNAWTQTDGNTGEAGNGGGPGNPIEVDGAVEDMRIENNTFFDTRGSNPQIWHSQVNWIEGCLVQNNLLWFNQNAQGFSGEQNFHTVLTPAIGGIASALFNSQCTNDPNVAGGIMGNNVAVPYYNNSAAPSGFVTPSTICTSFGGSTLTLNACSGGTPLITTVLNGANAAANLAAIGFTAPTPVLATVPLNLKLLYNALCISGNHCTTDGTDMGADMNALLTAQGFVQTPTVGNITSTVAVVNWWTYDGSVACAVDYAVAPNDPSTQTGGGRQTALTGNSQSVTITAAAHSAILYRVLCPVSQPTGSFQLR